MPKRTALRRKLASLPRACRRRASPSKHFIRPSTRPIPASPRSTRSSSAAAERSSRSTPRSISTTTRPSAIRSGKSCATWTKKIRRRSRPRNTTSTTSSSTATMDIIKLYGGAPANFLDVGGGATTEKVTEAFKIMLRIPHLKAILVNIFGGIMKCDVIAAGVVAAARQVSLKVPLVVRLEGTNVDLGKKILAESGLPIISGNNMADAAQKVVAAAEGGSKATKGKI